MKISKKTEYGLSAMTFLAKNLYHKGTKGSIARPFSLREISAETRIPFVFLTKIFSKLEKAKLVKAKLGAQGGYFLTKPASKITVEHIFMALEENLEIVHCFGCSMTSRCASKNMWKKVEQSMSKTMGKITLSDLIK